MRKLNIDLTEWQTRIVIEALKELESKWLTINQSTTDENEQADYANDLVELGMTKDHIVQAAIKLFGKRIAS